MKKLTLAASALLSACAQTEQAPIIGMANPASVFCIEQGGKLEIRKDESGNEYGVCIFADGKKVEEWEFFRKHHK